ncbi:acylphosphatase [Candidatus Parcubacteria bacterium]|nr:acylphosphatase [Candidatus Parcubacteria bacterium]
MDKRTRVHLFISGRVHGVFFRESTRIKAQQLGINGWVKNLNDGRVEAVFEGEDEKIKKIIKWARQGPIISRVDDIEIKEEKYENKFKNFEIRY